MACNIPYIREQQLSETEKSRLEEIHLDIFRKAKESKAFREINSRFQAIKSKYADATSFVGRINNENEAKVAELVSIGGGNAVLSVNVLPLMHIQHTDLVLQLPKGTIGDNVIFYDPASLSSKLKELASIKLNKSGFNTDIPISSQKERMERIITNAGLSEGLKLGSIVEETKTGQLYTYGGSTSASNALRGEKLLSYYEDGLDP